MHGFGFGISGILWMLLQWGILILGVFLIVHWVSKGTKVDRQEDSAIQIIRERYASGDLDEVQFHQMMKKLQSK